jgi:tetratricopeptide (TPR) repeat protein
MSFGKRRPFEDGSHGTNTMSAISLATMKTREVIRSVPAILLFLGSLHSPAQAGASRQQQIEAHNRQAQQYLKENRADLASAELRAIIALDPNNVDARGNLGVMLFFQGDYADAIPQLRAALKLQPGLWKIEALLGMSEKRTSDAQGALDDLEKAFPKLQEEKIRIEAGMELIEIYNGTGDLDKAAAIASVLRGSYPTNVDVLYASYRIYSDLAGESMLSLSMAAPDSARMHQVMAHEMARQGDTEAAIRNYREALKLAPQLPGLHFELAEALHAASSSTEKQEAEGEYKAALAVNPFDEESERRLGEIAAERGNQKEANAYYSRAIQLQPNDAEANIDLAKLISISQPEKAEALLQRALQLDPTIAVAHYRLSILYRNAGRTADAQRELEAYRNYKQMKEKLRGVYHEMRLKTSEVKSDETDAPNSQDQPPTQQ